MSKFQFKQLDKFVKDLNGLADYLESAKENGISPKQALANYKLKQKFNK